MSTQQLVMLAIKASIFLISFALGLGTRGEDAAYLFRHPGLLLRSVGAMNVVMPVFVVALAMAVGLPPPVRIALLALAVSPVPPLLPGRQESAGGEPAYAVGLLIAACFFSVVLMPGVIELIGRVFDRDVHVPFGRVLPILLASVLAPLSLGMLLRRWLPDLARRIRKPVRLGATLLLVLGALPMLASAWPVIRELIGHGTLAALLVFALVGLATGHAFGGPDPDDRTVLALATATRHPGVALALASVNFPSEKAVIGVVILHLLISALASVPYAAWRKRVHAAQRET